MRGNQLVALILRRRPACLDRTRQLSVYPDINRALSLIAPVPCYVYPHDILGSVEDIRDLAGVDLHGRWAARPARHRLDGAVNSVFRQAAAWSAAGAGVPGIPRIGGCGDTSDDLSESTWVSREKKDAIRYKNNGFERERRSRCCRGFDCYVLSLSFIFRRDLLSGRGNMYI